MINKLLLLLAICVSSKYSFGQRQSISQLDRAIFKELKNTSFRVIKLKNVIPREYYGISKDSSHTYRITVIWPDSVVYDIIYVNDKLSRIQANVYTGIGRQWEVGTYYFDNGMLIAKKEQRENLKRAEDLKVLAKEYLLKAKTL